MLYNKLHINYVLQIMLFTTQKYLTPHKESLTKLIWLQWSQILLFYELKFTGKTNVGLARLSIPLHSSSKIGLLYCKL